MVPGEREARADIETEAIAELMESVDRAMRCGMDMAKERNPELFARGLELVRAGHHRVELRVAMLDRPARVEAYLVGLNGVAEMRLFSYEVSRPDPKAGH